MPSRPIWPGRPYPLGASFDGSGTNFAVYSSVAERVELCLFDADDARVAHRSWRAASAACGTRICPRSARVSATAFACTGPWDLSRGLRSNPAKLLVDPYARAISRGAAMGPALRGDDGDGQPVERGHAPPRRFARSSRSRTSTGATITRSNIRGTRRSSTSCTSRASPSGIPRSPRAARHLRGLAHPAAIRHLASSG